VETSTALTVGEVITTLKDINRQSSTTVAGNNSSAR